MTATLAFRPSPRPAQRPARFSGLGTIRSCVRGPSGTPAQLISSLKAGLPFVELEELRLSLGLPLEKLAPILGISMATLHRRKAAGRLDTAESDRVVRFAKLLGKALVVLESEANARLWLSSPQVGLGGEIPLHYAETEVGAREVEDLLGRIEEGVYS